MVTHVSIWEQMLHFYVEMNDSQANPTDIAGAGMDPMDAILAQLRSSDPDPSKIIAALDKLETSMKAMIKTAKNYGPHGLHPVSDPTMIKGLLMPTLALIEKLKTEIGTPQFGQDFTYLQANVSHILQDIAQG